MTATVVESVGFIKRYGERVAVDGVTFSVAAGEVFGLIGPDGAGKSSLLKAVAGVLAFEGGALTVFDTALDSESAAEAVKGRMGLMPQGLGQNLYPELSIEENVDFFARLRLVPTATAEDRKRRLFAITRLAPFKARPVKQLSGGMKQKLGLVCTLIHAPELIILDEPTTGVDPVSRRDFWTILAELLQETQSTALVSTAYMDEASAFDRVMLMHEGRALAIGTPAEIRDRQPGSVLTLSNLNPDEVNQLGARLGYLEPRGLDWRLFLPGLTGDAANDCIAATLGRSVPARVSLPDLDDAFIAIVAGPTMAPTAAVSAAAEPSSGAAIEAVGLCRTFGDFRAVDQASFTVKPGEVFGLLGANGAGKTTVIKMLTGILPPSAGAGRVAGADMRRAGREIKKRIGYMSQAFSLYTDLTALENIRLYASIYGLSPRQANDRTDWIIDMAGLAGFEHMLAASLPMGQRQRLALGCALVHSPRVLFLDEPTSGVDPIGRRHFWDILFRLAREDQVAVLVTTHYMNEAERCDQLALMYAGRVVADGTPAALKAALVERRGQLLTLETDLPRDALRVLREKGFDVGLHGRELHLFSHDPVALEAQAAALLAGAGLSLLHVVPRDVGMEDVFVAQMTELEHQP